MKTKLLHLSTSTRLILCLSASLPLCVKSFADEPATNAQIVAETEQSGEIVAETLFEDGTTNTWTAADLTDALGLMNRKYHRDIETESGRTKWHGKRMGMYVIDVDLGTGGFERGPALVSLYEDGFAWTNKGTRVTLKDPEAVAKAKAAAEARQAEWERTHLPPDVAALLQRRRDAANGVTNTVTNTGN